MLCKREDGLHQQLALSQNYYNFCLPHASFRQLLPQPVRTNGTGSAKTWRPLHASDGRWAHGAGVRPASSPVLSGAAVAATPNTVWDGRK